MITIDGKYIEQITKANVNNLIFVDYFADAIYQDDGAVDFMLIETEEMDKLAEAVFERSFDSDYEIVGYITVSPDKRTVEMELVYRDYIEDKYDVPISFELTPTERELVLPVLEEEVKAQFHMTLDEMIAEAKGE